VCDHCTAYVNGLRLNAALRSYAPVTAIAAIQRPRTLRHLVIAGLALALLLLTATQFIVNGSLAERQLLDIESRDAFARLRKLHRAIDFLAEDLDSTTTDWAQWDQMYRYAKGEYPEFPEYNLIPVTYTGLRLDLAAIVDIKGNVVFAKRLADDGKTLLAAPDDFVDSVQRGGRLYELTQGRGRTSGLIATASGAFLISAQPIMTYDGEPLGGSRLIMGRSLMRFVEPSLERVTGETLVAHAPDPSISEWEQAKRSAEGDVLRLQPTALEGVTTLTDLWQVPVAQLRLRADRPTQQLVRLAQRRLLIAALVIGGLFAFAGLTLVRRRVIAPLERLSSAVERIGDRTGAEARVPIERSSHEFETLSAAINTMIEQRDEQQSLRRDRDAAVEANRLKSEFLAIMSHEIRTPMNGVLGMCELLQHTDLDARQRRMSETIVGSAQSLLEILNDILDFSKIEAGRLELESSVFSPTDLIQNVAAPFAAVAQAKHLALQTSIAPNVPAHVIGDAMRLRQVLSNLLSNAVKFTEHGSVSLKCELSQEDATTITLQFIVRDSGIGIPLHAQERIFDPFAQADSGTARRFGGTGLGLAIVRRLAHLMKGEVRVDSEIGKGATFIVTIPLRRTAPTDATGSLRALAQSKSRQVLLAEDNPVNREVLKEMLEHAGANVTVAENGVEAVARANEREFDVILMDCHMPVMDGLAAASKVRVLERTKGRSPTFIVALTADVTAENRERCLAVGMDDLAGKPISQAKLQELIRAG